jgi:hypothetical protein
MLDQSRIGEVLTGHEAEALFGGPPVTAMLIQNTNPVQCRAGAEAGAAGFLRATTCSRCVHEQFMTDTAKRWRTWCCRRRCSLSTTIIYQGRRAYQHHDARPEARSSRPRGRRTNHEVICANWPNASASATSRAFGLSAA